MSNKKVAIYTTPTCTYCRQTKAFFQENKVDYEEHDVAADAAKRQEMVEKTGQMGVPVITISDQDGGNEEVIVGFDKPKLSSLLGIA